MNPVTDLLVFTNITKYFFSYWWKVISVTTSTAFGKKYWRAAAIWFLSAIITLIVNENMGLPEPVKALQVSSLVGLSVILIIWLAVFITIPPRIHGPITSMKYISAHYDNLSQYISSGERLISTKGAISEESMTVWRDAVINYLNEVKLHHSWKDKFKDTGEFSHNRILSTMATKQMWVKNTEEQETLTIMKCYVLNLRNMREDCYNYIMKLHAKAIG